MNRYARLSLAVLVCLAFAGGCTPPATAAPHTPTKAINLDARSPAMTSFDGIDTLIGTRGNLYHIDTIGRDRTFAATNSQIAALMIDPRTNALYITARSPGQTEIYYHDAENRLIRLKVVVL